MSLYKGAMIIAGLGAGVLFLLASRTADATPVYQPTLADDPVLPESEFNYFLASIQEAAKMTEAPVTPQTLKYFGPDEFQGWFNQMSPSLLRKLDEFRELWGAPIMISPVNGGVGRRLGTVGKGSLTQHNIDKWGEVRAVDIFPQGLNSVTAGRARQIARQVGFTGIGLYNDTQPSWMMHVDVRTGKTASNPAEWARVNHKYVGIGELV